MTPDNGQYHTAVTALDAKGLASVSCAWHAAAHDGWDAEGAWQSAADWGVSGGWHA